MLARLANVAMWSIASFVAANGTPNTVLRDGILHALVGGPENRSVSVSEEGAEVTIEWQCPVAEEEEVFCVVGSTLSYYAVIGAVRDKRIDVSGRTLIFKTLVQRREHGHQTIDVPLLAASWNGTKLMETNWKTTSLEAALDDVEQVEADRHFPTLFELQEVCNRLYGNPPRFCWLAKESARR